MAKQGRELVTASTQAALNKAILDELLYLDTVMQEFYSKFGPMHKAVIHLNRWQQGFSRRAHTLTRLHIYVDYMQEWMMRYKGALLDLPKMMKASVVELKGHIRSQIRNYEEPSQLITNIQGSHPCVFKSMDVVVHAHLIPSIRNLTQSRTKA